MVIRRMAVRIFSRSEWFSLRCSPVDFHLAVIMKLHLCIRFSMKNRKPYRSICLKPIDSQTIHFTDWAAKRSFSIPLQGGERTPIYRDSTSAVPIMGGDYRKGRVGFYVISSLDAQTQNFDAARKIGELNVTRWALSPSRRFLLEYHAAGEVWKVSLPDGKRERLGGAFTNPNIELMSINFSYDDKEAVYATKRISGKLVLIEDFIK